MNSELLPIKLRKRGGEVTPAPFFTISPWKGAIIDEVNTLPVVIGKEVP
jgi:hypothetical protein